MAAGYLSQCGSVGAHPGQPVFNIAGTRVGIQVIPANSAGPRVVVPTNAGAQALVRQRVATTNGPSSQVRDQMRYNSTEVYRLVEEAAE